MPLDRPSLTDLRRRVTADVAAKLERGPLLRRSIPYLLAESVAGASHSLWGYLEHIGQQIFPDTADAENLDRWAVLLGEARREADFAEGGVLVNGSIGSAVPLGALFRRSDGVEYEATAGVTLTTPYEVVPVRSLTAGELANTDGKTEIALSTPISGISASATVDEPGIGGGADRESDDLLRDRTLARLRSPGQGGNSADYVRWAKSVAGVTRAWTIPLMNGLGTVGVAIMRDGDSNPFPSGTALDDVQTVIDDLRPVGMIGVEVFAPTPVLLDLDLSITPDSPTIRSLAESALADLLYREGNPIPREASTPLPLSRISEAISSVDGERSHQIIGPTANPVMTPREVLRLGTVTWWS